MPRVYNYLTGLYSGGIESYLTGICAEMKSAGAEFIVLTHFKTQEGKIYEQRLLEGGARLVHLADRCEGRLTRLFKLAAYMRRNMKKDDVLCLHSCTMECYPYAVVAHLLGIHNVVYFAHNVPYLPEQGKVKRVLARALRDVFGKIPMRRLACSQMAGEQFFGKGVPFQSIYYAVASARFRFDAQKRESVRRQWGVGPDEFVVGQVARLVFQKNHMFTLSIFKELKKTGMNCRLVLIGEGSDREKVVSAIEENALQKDVLLLDPTDQVQDCFFAFDCFVFPSHYEGLGIVALEAQACGLPIICSENIPQEAFVSRLIWREELASPDRWVERLCSIQKMRVDRATASREGMEDVVRAGHTAENAVRELLSIFAEGPRGRS